MILHTYINNLIISPITFEFYDYVFEKELGNSFIFFGSQSTICKTFAFVKCKHLQQSHFFVKIQICLFL